MKSYLCLHTQIKCFLHMLNIWEKKTQQMHYKWSLDAFYFCNPNICSLAVA